MIDNKLKNNLTDFIFRIYENRWLKSIRYGLLITQPFILIGLILVIIIDTQSYYINNISSNDFLITLLKSNIIIYDKIHTITRIILLLTTCYSLAKNINKDSYNDINPSIVSIVGFISAIVLTKDTNILDLSECARWSISRIIISLAFSEIFMFIYSKLSTTFTIFDKRYERVLRQSIRSIIPMLLILLILVFARLILGGSLNSPILDVLSTSSDIYKDNGLYGAIRYLLDTQIYWFFGSHGGYVIDPIVFNKSYLNVFCNIGGSGSTICLIVAICISKSNKQSKSIAKLSILPSIFNINEIIIYGLPVVLNPIYIIPFLLTPIILSFLTWCMLLIGFVNIENPAIQWTVPIFLNGYTATKNFSGTILQIINIIIGTFIYLPFVHLSNQIFDKEDAIAYNSLKHYIFSDSKLNESITDRSDNIGHIANILSLDLSEALSKNTGIYLEYQPQVNKKNIVVGAEALVRWNHPSFGYIPPPIIITLAEESGLIHDLGRWIFKESCYQLSQWNKQLVDDIYISINISSTQLKDPLFTDYVNNVLNLYSISADKIKLEITETLALGDDLITKTQLNRLTNFGIKLVIDDFGVGYNPILYIKKYKIDCIKIDGSLIRDIDVSEDSRNIVDAMYKLCESSGLDIVNEFVETYRQKSILDSIGDGIYQGYYFSKPLNGNKCLEYIIKTNSN